MIDNLPSRIRTKITVHPSGCWYWMASRDRGGYGYAAWGGRMRQAHRVTFELLVGLIPEGLQIDHLCRNPPCVNPDHLEPVTPRENTMRGNTDARRKSEQTHCVNGHEFTLDNIYTRPSRPGTRECRTCNKRTQRRRNQESPHADS